MMRLEISWKLGVPKPVTASHPELAAKEYSQHGVVSIEEPTPQA